MSSSPEEYEYSKVLLKDLWVQLALIESAELKACSAYIDRMEQQRLI